MSEETYHSIPTRSETARAHKHAGGFIAGVLPIHYPRALFRAFNILPMEVWGPPQVDATHGSAHLQPYVCSVARNALSFLKLGGLDVVDLLVVPHGCDTLQGLGSILLDFVQPAQPVLPIYVPRRKGERAVEFLADEFRDIHARLEEMTQSSPSKMDLMESIRIDEDADKRLSQLYQHRKNLPLSDYEFYRLIRAREFLPAETFSELAAATMNRESEVNRDAVPLILSGIVPEPMGLLESISHLGGVVIADDMACCGRRVYPAGESEDPFVRMAERILNASPDSTRGTPLQERLEHLLRMAQASGARGIIFYLVKFCEPELFDLPRLREGLLDAGIPSTTVEIDLNDTLANQALTRIEAFLEMVI